MSSGVCLSASSKTWLSVITSFGLLPRRESVSESSVSRVTTDMAPLSSTSRMVCCWGRIRRPLGAALSMGTTSTTRSRGSSRSPTRRFPRPFSGTSRASRSFSSSIPSPVRALTQMCRSSFLQNSFLQRSFLLKTTR